MLTNLRQAWTKSSPSLLLQSQTKLLNGLVKTKLTPGTLELNSVDTGSVKDGGETIVLAHGFGSGLGFFFKNVDPIVNNPRVKRVVMFDWLGMGGSLRPDCRQAPRLGIIPCCESKFSPEQAVDFFIDPVERWCEAMGLEDFTLVGHSLGGYLSAHYAIKYPKRVKKLVLASPVGFPSKPKDALRRGELPAGLLLLDALWSANVTPQQLVRWMGYERGMRTIRRALGARIPHLQGEDVEHLADYLYHITVARASGEFAMNSLLMPVRSTSTIGVYARHPLSEVIHKMEVPEVKVLYGDHDWMRPNEASARESMAHLASKGSHATVHILPQAGHHLYLDNPGYFHAHIHG